MAAQTEETERPRTQTTGDIPLSQTGKASTTYLKGQGLAWDGSGDLVAAGNTSGLRTAGLCMTTHTTGASVKAGPDTIYFREGCIVEMPQDGNLGAGDVGKNIYWLDNQTMSNAATATNLSKAGWMVEYLSASKVKVCIGRFKDANA